MYEKQRWSWLFSPSNIPFAFRLLACVTSLPICALIYWLTFTKFYDSRVLIIPMAIWAWCFDKKGAGTYLLCFLTGLGIYYLLYQRSGDSLPNIPISIFIDIPIMIIVGGVILSFRKKQTHRDTEPLYILKEEQKRQHQLALEQVRQLEQIKTQFLINVNHELRTPLTATYGYFELLKMLFEQKGQLDYKTHGAYLQDALHYCEDLCSIVNNILDTMDIDNIQPVQINERCNVGQVILETCGNVDIVQNEQNRIHLQVAEDLHVQANVHYLRHILHQLLTNAFKYTPPGSPITIRAEVDPGEADVVCISIKDMGPGIPLRDQAHIFDQFARLPRDVAGTMRGAGLGLYICKHLVERMQGQIWVESSGLQGRGSCFRFTLPRAIAVPTSHTQLSPKSAQTF
ncbi:sensor histidine kinase [Dictyobacter kobayashii]|uniref:histidine kinase n=1 Tax=Dictyobacter kobayashii TaxID=2014872 RepID=A0A402AGQ4_9CHLR|nr:HAMP domain-containing sensor histidine kinase [Dictyobacter kobayashii]GCE18243.1 hypothetical protein KDK_20430 [Dictyobacter kobayashii]